MVSLGADDEVVGGAEAPPPNPRAAYILEQHARAAEQLRDAHLLLGQMILSFEAGDLDAFGQYGRLHLRAQQEAGATILCFEAARSSEGSA